MPTRSRQTVARATAFLSLAVLLAGSGHAFADDKDITNQQSAVPTFSLPIPSPSTADAFTPMFPSLPLSTWSHSFALSRVTFREKNKGTSPSTMVSAARSSLTTATPDVMETLPPVTALAFAPSLASGHDVEDPTHSEVKGGGSSMFVTMAHHARDVVVNSLTMIGVRYKWGGTNPSSGLDCSGFVRYVFQDTLGLELPRRAEDMAHTGEKVNVAELKPGDLVFFNTMRRTFSHVGIYVGDNKFIHSPRAGEHVRIDAMDDSYWEHRFTGARRMEVVDRGDEGSSSMLPVVYRSEGAKDSGPAY